MKRIGLSALIALSLCAGSVLAEDAMTDWSGRINLGGFVTDGNSNKKAVVADAKAQARDDHNRYTVGGEVRYAEDEGTETEDEYMLYAEYDRFIDDRWFAGIRASYESDDIADLDQRIKLGPYVGYQFYESDPLNLQTRLGLNYMSEEFESGDTEEDLAAVWGVDYDQKLIDDTIQVFYKHDFAVPFDNTDNFLLDMETGVRFPIAKVLTGTVQVDFDWDGEPAAGAEEKDTKYSIKLGYEF